MNVWTLRLVIAISAAGIVGCGEDKSLKTAAPERGMRQCALFLEKMLRSPSSLKVLSHKAIVGIGEEDLFTIEYDAANAYGTLVRNEISCFYRRQVHPEQPLDLNRVGVGGRWLTDTDMVRIKLDVAGAEADAVMSKYGNR